MDLETIEPALLAWVAALTGVEAACCLWENAPRVRSNGVLVLLSWVSSVGLGVDETRWEFEESDEPLDEMTPVVAGARRSVLQITVESIDQRPGHTARNYLERARDRLRWRSTLAMLEAVNVGLVGAEQLRTADSRVDQRVLSRAVLEVALNLSSCAADTAGRTSYIAEVVTTAAIVRPDGTELPSPLQPGGSLP